MMAGGIKKMAQSLELSEILRIFAADMEDKHLYIISGPNGAGKTTASRGQQEMRDCSPEVLATSI